MASDRIYLVRKTEFDRLENEINSARTTTIVGFTFSKERASSYINEMLADTHRKIGFYRGWDGHYYPSWTYEEIPTLPFHTPPAKSVTKA